MGKLKVGTPAQLFRMVLIRELAPLWRSAGAASGERPLAIMKAANERANIARKKMSH